VGVVEGAGTLQENNYFCPQNNKFWCILPQFLTGTNTEVTRRFETRILRFNRETKFTKTAQKLSKDSQSDQGGGRTIASP